MGLAGGPSRAAAVGGGITGREVRLGGVRCDSAAAVELYIGWPGRVRGG